MAAIATVTINRRTVNRGRGRGMAGPWQLTLLLYPSHFRLDVSHLTVVEILTISA